MTQKYIGCLHFRTRTHIGIEQNTPQNLNGIIKAITQRI